GARVIAEGDPADAAWLRELGAAEVVEPGADVQADVTVDLSGDRDEVTSRQRATGYEAAADGAALAIVARLIDEGDLRIVVDRVFDLADAAEAHRLVESGGVRGAVVLRVADL
ncbi:zinc-binding dehydrogenase, partial [Mesorhizobium japonicum]|uniref:zinc-binding dehydrogenase n=1 Tax=Mesorhizobium japonicum TaxID=2066070 RepID=UPI003B59819A